MPERTTLYRALLVAVAAILAYQLFLPPIVGLADQGDFGRIIGRFGYAPEQRDGLRYAFVPGKYVPDASARIRDWEQPSSEYLFVAAAVFLNHIVSKDGMLDIRVVGLVHALVFLLVFARLLRVTRMLRSRNLIWIAAVLILTDVAYISYFNSFYAEPASLLFALLLISESIEICQIGPSPANLARWSLWAVLFVLAKPQNITIGVLLAIFALHLGRSPRSAGVAASAAILSAAVFSYFTTPAEMKRACAYNLIFWALLPESRNPGADLQALGMDPALRDYSRTGPWSPQTAYPELVARGIIGRNVTQFTVARFYLARPTRLWRHIQAELRKATLMRPALGNFEPSAGLPPGAQSSAFALWSDFHRAILAPFAKFLFFALPLPAFVAVVRSRSGLRLQFTALLGLACLIAFLTAIFADAWEDTKHLLLFNLLLDAFLVSAAAAVWPFAARWSGSRRQSRVRAHAQRI